MTEQYRVEIDDAYPQAIVTINGGIVRRYDTIEQARAFVEGLFYDGYPRDLLVDATGADQ